MIKYLIIQFEENKHKLEEYFRTNKQVTYASYDTILTKIFELCLLKANEYTSFDINNMTIIDDSEYQGTKIFIIPIRMMQPTIKDYVVTNTFYGSWSGSDTILSICDIFIDGDTFPTDEQVKGYMTLSLHLVQKMKWLG